MIVCFLFFLFSAPFILAQNNDVELILDEPIFVTESQKLSKNWFYKVDKTIRSEEESIYIFVLPCVGTHNMFLNVNSQASPTTHQAEKIWPGKSTPFQFFRVGPASIDTKLFLSFEGIEESVPGVFWSARIVATFNADWPADQNFNPTFSKNGDDILPEVYDNNARINVTVDVKPTVAGFDDTYELYTLQGLIENVEENPLTGCSAPLLMQKSEQQAEPVALDGGNKVRFSVENLHKASSDPPFLLAVRLVRRPTGVAPTDGNSFFGLFTPITIPDSDAFGLDEADSGASSALASVAAMLLVVSCALLL